MGVTSTKQQRRSKTWVIDNVYMLARRELRRLDSGRGQADAECVARWHHVVRLCELSATPTSILRRSLPTEITNG